MRIYTYIYIIRRIITITIDLEPLIDISISKLISFSTKYNGNFARTKRSVQVRPGRYCRAMSTWVEPQKIHILITGAKSCVNRWVAAFLRKLPALTRSLCARTPHFCPSRRDRILFFLFSAAETY